MVSHIALQLTRVSTALNTNPNTKQDYPLHAFMRHFIRTYLDVLTVSIRFLQLLLVLLDSPPFNTPVFRRCRHPSWGFAFDLNKGPTRRQLVGLWTRINILPAIYKRDLKQ